MGNCRRQSSLDAETNCSAPVEALTLWRILPSQICGVTPWLAAKRCGIEMSTIDLQLKEDGHETYDYLSIASRRLHRFEHDGRKRHRLRTRCLSRRLRRRARGRRRSSSCCPSCYCCTTAGRRPPQDVLNLTRHRLKTCRCTIEADAVWSEASRADLWTPCPLRPAQIPFAANGLNNRNQWCELSR
jgi:hypothetical protein